MYPQHISMQYAIVDLETTGGRPHSDKIIEIAIVIYDGKQLVDRFHSLINPGTPIPSYISQLTGIDDHMLCQAPYFHQLAKQIVELTEGCVFVAHNAQFDYGFLKAAFRELGYNYRRPTLCTLRLSRQLLPHMPKYGLDALCQHLGILNPARHRAWADAQATAQLFAHLLQLGEQKGLQHIFHEELSPTALPPYIDRASIEALPEETGVYYLLGQHEEVLYVGKSRNIYRRVLQHFQVKEEKSRHFRLKNLIHHIRYECTGSELIALLLENHQIKQLSPAFNRAQRHHRCRIAITAKENKQGYLQLLLQPTDRLDGMPLYFTGSRQQARDYLYQLSKQHRLCLKLSNLYESRQQACFDYHVGLCQGACMGTEPPESYNQRLLEAFNQLRAPHSLSNYLITELGRSSQEKSYVLVEDGMFKGFGYVPANTPKQQLVELRHRYLVPCTDYKDQHQIIYSYLKKNPHTPVIYF